jgi:hypothetical protein
MKLFQVLDDKSFKAMAALSAKSREAVAPADKKQTRKTRRIAAAVLRKMEEESNG